MNTTHAWHRALKSTTEAGRSRPALLPVLADRCGENPLLIGTGERCVTYRELHTRVDRFARLALDLGLRKGDVVGLSMANSVDDVAIWLGLARVGCGVALINMNLPPDAAAHCPRAAAALHVVSGWYHRQCVPKDVVWPTLTTASGQRVADWLGAVVQLAPTRD